ncbi:MAG: hypothetical protein JO182_13915 [Acidobacteriaceae bacterium]|nr:hypothetical protein [Acidobacteriaceae bacterium]MBV9035580.1 hypothetical protein [Acidobacteriaceae bacterium]MBV9222855.1 hypothetical protein [Acidobacteriaceae bacterium]MBV9308308.1 hypothetical protein [Acidobacteriaceae bacterium]MBV9678447.1 hypothetical protein [Acidobacteriaceae bacterium]
MSHEEPIEGQASTSVDVKEIVKQAISEFVRGEQQKAEPAYKAELQDERKRRESLELRLNQLVEENRKARALAEEADRSSQIRSELQRLGVAKIDLAFRAVKDDVVRGEDGRLAGRGMENKSLQDYLASFVQENPELLPARIAGGSGAQVASKNTTPTPAPINLNAIKPGMNKDELDQIRKEISRLASQSVYGS